MAAPTYVTASTGTTDSTGAWTHTCAAPGAAGRLILVQVFQDGTGTSHTVTGATNINALDGTANTWTEIPGTAPNGFPGSAGFFAIYAGRSTGTSAPTISGGNDAGNDLYIRAYEFQDASTGTTWEAVFENDDSSNPGSTPGSIVTATSATASDAIVTTLGVDRLALNFLAINDDNPFAGFTGESGGTWTTRASYAESGGTDGAIYLITAPMPSAGTIDGGTGSITDSDVWITAGFAIIGTTVAQNYVPKSSPYPQILPQ